MKRHECWKYKDTSEQHFVGNCSVRIYHCSECGHLRGLIVTEVNPDTGK